ncbi:hypothetical protein A2716_01940 [candidate division WWE3 bacterium RIFCSPHIGHO2_01_FULL_40_23]|uniref:Thioredoxin domain-containing protein n=1 Tax=candidate division WWE3 bacterium RIFCSPLOWO2_01_FULL_41_18 TaxID=1802625 RepID=A0A1F4VES1_UNCKA|nr:MAG: hypothetical protein A2716_01940 [candidate division WWE3 bacterium RIFCSPHIGHO2_01_FULL_40_23]OGC55751.1 MAG: hypothetical protein A3A78_01790 [candidate division WWE3 bacterium RIFCSPLOWO2_01_FULL_41_18]
MKELTTPIAVLISGVLISLSILFQGQLKLTAPNVKGAKTAVVNDAPQPTGSTAPSPTPLERVSVSADNDPFLGSQNAKVEIIEFSDFQCPYCKRLFDNSYSKLKQEYIDTSKVKLVFRDYPLSFHQNAQIAAESAGCANDQGRFWEYHDLLFTKQDEWSALSNDAVKAKFGTYAANLGMDSFRFNSCVNASTFKQEVDSDLNDGTKVGVSGTPTLFINGKRLVGAQPYETIKAEIEAELSK